jgi:PleD family two-component response regulator
LETIALELHDHIGDSKLISLDKLSETTVELEQLVHCWKNILLPTKAPETMAKSLEQAVHSDQFRKWLETLFKASRQYVQSVGDRGHVRELQSLRLELQKALDETEASRRKHKNITVEVPTLLQLRSLVLDDSSISRKMLTHALEEIGHTVAAASNVTEFWQILSEFKPNLIFLDINMPDIKGDQVCAQLRKRAELKDIPVIIFSSLPDDELADLAQKVGASGSLSKQHGLGSLQEYVTELLSNVIF